MTEKHTEGKEAGVGGQFSPREAERRIAQAFGAGPPPIPPTAPQEHVDTLSDRERDQPGSGPRSQEEQNAARSISPENNPANQPMVTRETRISMNTPELKLEMPPIDGYHCHWFLEQNIPRARQAGYVFVQPGEIPTADRNIGGRSPGVLGEGLGSSTIQQIGGEIAGRPVMLTLMKIQIEWYFDDQRKIAERNLRIIKQIFSARSGSKPIRMEGESERDYGLRYTREAVIDMSNGRFRKA